VKKSKDSKERDMTKQERKELKKELSKVREVRVQANGVNVWVKVTEFVARGIVNSLKQGQRAWLNTNFHKSVGYLVVK